MSARHAIETALASLIYLLTLPVMALLIPLVWAVCGWQDRRDRRRARRERAWLAEQKAGER